MPLLLYPVFLCRYRQFVHSSCRLIRKKTVVVPVAIHPSIHQSIHPATSGSMYTTDMHDHQTQHHHLPALPPPGSFIAIYLRRWESLNSCDTLQQQRVYMNIETTRTFTAMKEASPPPQETLLTFSIFLPPLLLLLLALLSLTAVERWQAASPAKTLVESPNKERKMKTHTHVAVPAARLITIVTQRLKLCTKQ